MKFVIYANVIYTNVNIVHNPIKMSTAKFIDVKTDKNLLNPDFDGYKLSLKPINKISVEIPCEIEQAKPNPDQYSFIHAKLFTLHNHLCNDPWNPESIYFIGENLNIYKAYVPETAIVVNKVWEIAENHPRKHGLHCTLVFTSEKTAVCSDGSGMIYLLDTGVRTGEGSWKHLFSGEILGPGVNFIITAARYEEIENVRQVNLVLSTIELNLDGKKYDHVLHWITLIEAQDSSWGATQIDTLRGKDLHYCAIEAGSKALYIASDAYFKFDYQNPEPTPKVEVKKVYTWEQSDEDITLTLKFEQISKPEIQIKTTRQAVQVFRNNDNVFEIKLANIIDPDLTTWEIKNDMLVVVLSKSEAGLMWHELVPGGDARGEEIINPVLAEEIHQKLAHLCSETDKEDSLTTVSSCPLEECDMGDSPVFARYERETHSQTHTAGLNGYNFLFNLQTEVNKPPGMVLRHDVDACLFEMKFDEAGWSIKHVGTINAFGYIQASKQQKKFLTCAPNLAYAVIAESTQHIVLYRQHRQIDEGCQLRHRGRGVQVNSTAELQRIALPPDEILGVVATNRSLFVLNPKRLNVFSI